MIRTSPIHLLRFSPFITNRASLLFLARSAGARLQLFSAKVITVLRYQENTCPCIYANSVVRRGMNERDCTEFCPERGKKRRCSGAAARLFNRVQNKICRSQPFDALPNKSNTKRLILALLGFVLGFSATPLQSQNLVEVQVDIFEPYPVNLDYYLNNAQNAVLTLFNTTNSEQEIYLHTAIIGNNGVSARTRPTYRPSVPLSLARMEVLVLTGSDLENTDVGFNSFGSVDLSAISQEQLDFIQFQRALPEGTYQICIEAFDWNTMQSLGAGCSIEFTVFYGDLPYIIEPFENDQVIDSGFGHLSISWEHPFTQNPNNTNFVYRLKMVDLTNQPYSSLEDVMNSSGNFVMLDADNLMDFNYMYDFPPENELEEGHQYAIRVQAVDPTGLTPVTNNGYSEIRTFFYGINPDDPDTSSPAVAEAEETTGSGNCEGGDCVPYNISGNPTAVASIAGFNQLHIGHFTIKELSLSDTDGSRASGSGVITVPFLDSVKVAVSFSNVKVDANRRIFEGEVQADNDYVYDPTAATPNDISTLDRIIRTERLISATIGGRDRTMVMPIGIVWNIGGDHLMLAFNAMTFRSDRANCQVMYNMHYDSWGDFWASLSASDICLMPDGFGQEFYLHPTVDIPLPSLANIDYYLRGSVANTADQLRAQSTYVEVDCKGIASFGLHLKTVFPRSLLVPDSPDGSPGSGEVNGYASYLLSREEASAALGSQTAVSTGFLAQLHIDSFQIASLPGLGFSLREGWLDFSDRINPPNMVVPDNYQDADLSSENGRLVVADTWEGFYMKSLTARSAQGWLFDQERLEFGVDHVIIDELITARIRAANLISNGSLNNWFVSVDTLYLDLVQWSSNQTGTWNAGLGGRIGMPITGDDEFLHYTGLIQPQQSGNSPNMALLVQPGSNGLSFPFMQSAAATICPNSYVRLVQENGSSYFDSQLAGNMGVTFDDPISFTIPWVDFQFGYHSLDGFSNQAFSILGQDLGDGSVSCDNIPPVPELSQGEHAGTAAGSSGSDTPVSANNFPFRLEQIRILQQGLNDVSFAINPNIELGGGGINGFGADLDLSIRSLIRPGSTKLRFDGIDLGSLSIAVEDVFGLNIDGSIEFYQEEADKGARGELNVYLPLGISTELKADFGVRAIDMSRAFGETDQYFGYWYVDGMLGFPGVPLAPGVSLYGLGGGVYINMARQDGFENANVAAAQAVVDEVLGEIPNGDFSLSDSPDALRPIVAYGQYGLKLATRLGTSVPEALNMDVSIAGSFAQGIGINSLRIDGDAYMMSPIDQRDKGNNFWASAGFGWEYNGGQHKFQGNIDLYANVANGMIRGTMAGDQVVGVAFLADTGTDKWYFHAGNPDNRAGIEIDLGIIRQRASGYFMVGHDLPTELPIPTKVNNLIGQSSGSESNKLNNPNPVSGERSRAQGDEYYGQGTGIAFGVETEVEFNMRAWALYARLEAFLGFDINITQLNGATCYIPGEGNIQPGLNGWYATGQIYAGLEGAMGLKGKFLGKEREFELFQMAAAMIISGGGPNPTWAEGRAGASYSVLNGLIKGSVNFDVRIGDRCVPETEASDLIPVIYEVSPEDGARDVSVFDSDDLLATFLLPIDERIEVPIIWEPSPGVRQTILADLEIYIDEFSVKKVGSSSSMGGSKTYSQDRQAVTLKAGSKFESLSDYELTLRVKATDYTFNTNGLPFKEGNADWKEERIHEFKTGTTPYPIPDDEVVKTLPIRNQRYFLQDEINILYRLESPTILFTMNMGGDDYFPDNTEDKDYDYYFRWASYDGTEPIIVDANELRGKNSVELILSDLPRLQNDTYYSCQLVRKTTKFRTINGQRLPLSGLALNLREDVVSLSGNQFTPLGMSRADTLSVDITIDPGQYKAPNEEIIYQFDFKTSKYNTLAAKMANTTFSVSEVNNSLSKYPKLTFEMDENFDVFDIEGEYNQTYGGYVSLPRVEFSALVNNAQTTYSQSSCTEIINGLGYGFNCWTQPSYVHTPNNGESGYANYLGQSAFGFVQLYNQLQSIQHPIELSSGNESRTVNTTFPTLGNALGNTQNILRTDYTGNNLTFYLRDRRAAGYDGPLNNSELSRVWNNHVESQTNTPLLGSRHSGINLSGTYGGANSDFLDNLNLNRPTFTLEYYVPVWAAEDVMALSDVGAYLLARTYMLIPPDLGELPGGTGIGSSGGGIETSGGAGNNTIGQTQDASGSFGHGGSAPIITGGGNFGGSSGGGIDRGTNVNWYRDYLNSHYPALLVQLDNMNHAAKYYQLQNHKGDFDISLQPDRGFLIDTMLPGPKTTLPFNYDGIYTAQGNYEMTTGTYTAQGSYEMTTGSSANGSSYLNDNNIIQQQNQGFNQNYGGARLRFR